MALMLKLSDLAMYCAAIQCSVAVPADDERAPARDAESTVACRSRRSAMPTPWSRATAPNPNMARPTRAMTTRACPRWRRCLDCTSVLRNGGRGRGHGDARSDHLGDQRRPRLKGEFHGDLDEEAATLLVLRLGPLLRAGAQVTRRGVVSQRALGSGAVRVAAGDATLTRRDAHLRRSRRRGAAAGSRYRLQSDRGGHVLDHRLHRGEDGLVGESAVAAGVLGE